MQNAPDGARRHLKNISQAGLGITTEVANSNVTTNHFAGTKQRSWMLPGAQTATTAPVPAQTQKPKITQSNQSTARPSLASPSRVTNVVTGDRPAAAASTTDHALIPSASTLPLVEDSVHASINEVTRRDNAEKEPGQPASGISGGGTTPIDASAPAQSAENGNKAHNRTAQSNVIDLTASQEEEPSIETRLREALSQDQVAAQSNTQPSRTLTTSNVRHNLETTPVANVTGTSPAQRHVPQQAPQRTVSTGIHSHTGQPRASAGLLTPAPSPQTEISHILPRKRPLEVNTNTPPAPLIRPRSNSPRDLQRAHRSVTSPDLPQNHFAPHLHRERNLHHNLPPHRSTPSLHTSPFSPPMQVPHQQIFMQHTVSPQEGNRATNNHLRRVSSSTISQSPTTPRTRGSVQSKGQSYLVTFEAQLVDISRRMDLSRSARDLRIPWLRDACQHDDLFFLLLNQLYCTWTLEPDMLRQLGLYEASNAGFGVMQMLFGANVDFPEELIAFLAGWPNSPYSLRATPELRDWTITTGQFLARIGRGWNNFRQSCLKRHRPPTAREIDDAFGCPESVILPRAIFSSLLRQLIAGGAAEFQGAAFEMFITNQKQHLARCRGQAPAISVEEDAAIFDEIYRNLLAKYWRQQQSTAAIPPSPTTHIANTNIRDAPIHHTAQRSNSAAHVAQQRVNMPPPSATLIRPPDMPSSVLRHRASMPTTLDAANLWVQHHAAPAGLQQQLLGVGPIESNYMRTQMNQAVPNSMQISGGSSSSFSVAGTNRRVNSIVPHSPSIVWTTLVPRPDRLPALLTNPVPEQEALHQLHLRQPLSEVDEHIADQPPCLFQYVESCPSICRRFTTEQGFFTVEFETPEHLYERRARTIEDDDPCVLPKRKLTKDSILFNLRCVSLPKDQAIVDHRWAALPTCWPQHIFISINDTFLEIRRKRQHKRDLPIDITALVKKGQNSFTVSVHGDAIDKDKHFGVAVEAIGFRSRSQIKNMPIQISKEDALQAIVTEMTATTSTDDDEIEMITDMLTMSIADPFSSVMVRDPVRGKSCKHKTCFDLDTFLQSRPSDYKDAISSVYEWRCPIGSCREDVRPCSLVRDGFLQQVVAKLTADDLSSTRSIIVRNDGSWTPKIEADDGSASKKGDSDQDSRMVREGLSQELSVAAQEELAFLRGDVVPSMTANSGHTANVEVIELDDD